MSSCPICQKPQESVETCESCALALVEGRVFPQADGGLGAPAYFIADKPE
jgi:hypothetical protein